MGSAGGELGSFDEFYATHYQPISQQLYAYFGDPSDAVDVTQEAFCRAWERWSKVCRYDDPAAWVRRVAWRLAISRWRRTRTALAHRRGVAAAPRTDAPDEWIDLVRALATLPRDQRRAVVLHYLAGLSVGEIATDAGVAEGTVKSWLYRGRTALRAALAAPYDARSTPRPSGRRAPQAWPSGGRSLSRKED